MAMQRQLKVRFGEVFPVGAFLVGVVEPVFDFDAPKRADGVRAQATDEESRLLAWSLRADGMCAPGQAAKAESGKAESAKAA